MKLKNMPAVVALMLVAGFVALTLSLSGGAASVSAAAQNGQIHVTKSCPGAPTGARVAPASSHPRPPRGSTARRSSMTRFHIKARLSRGRTCWTVTSSSMPGAATGRLVVAPSIFKLFSGCARFRMGSVSSPVSKPVSMSTVVLLAPLAHGKGRTASVPCLVDRQHWVLSQNLTGDHRSCPLQA